MAGPKRTYDITALQRGLRLLHLFSESPRGLTAKQVAGFSRLPVSTVHRFLANLVTAGFLSCDSDGTYHLGIACFAIGQAAVGQLDIRRLSLPYLRELNQQTRETIHLTVRHGLSAVYVAFERNSFGYYPLLICQLTSRRYGSEMRSVRRYQLFRRAYVAPWIR